MREPPATLLINDAAQSYCDPTSGQMAMASMNDLKQDANDWIRSNNKNFSTDSITKAMYGLVAKGLLKIDRRTAKDPYIFFEP